MKIEYQEIVFIESKSESNTWYIFRPNGIEVKIVMFQNKIKSDRKLTDLEIEYLNNNLK